MALGGTAEAVSAQREWSLDSVPARAFLIISALSSELLFFPNSHHTPLDPSCLMGSQCTLFICSLFSKQRNLYKIKDTNPYKVTFTFLCV